MPSDAVAVIGCCERVLRAAQADAASVVADALAKRRQTDSTPATNPALHERHRYFDTHSLPTRTFQKLTTSADNLSQLHDVQPRDRIAAISTGP